MFSSKVVESWLVLLYSGQGSNLCLCGVAEERSADVTYGLEIRGHWSYIGVCGVSVTKN